MTFYRACDAYLQHKGFRDDPQAHRTTVEVLLTARVGAFFFANNLRVAQQALQESGLVPKMLSESRFNRRVLLRCAEWTPGTRLRPRIGKAS